MPLIPLQLSLKCNHQTLDPALGDLGPIMTLMAMAASVVPDLHGASWLPAPPSPPRWMPGPCLFHPPTMLAPGLASSSHPSCYCICSQRKPPPPWPDLLHSPCGLAAKSLQTESMPLLRFQDGISHQDRRFAVDDAENQSRQGD